MYTQSQDNDHLGFLPVVQDHVKADPDPDPAFHFNADPESDPGFHINVDLQIDGKLRPLVCRPSRPPV
jgi:hypothetical protein